MLTSLKPKCRVTQKAYTCISNHPFGQRQTITHSNEDVHGTLSQMKCLPFPYSITVSSELEQAGIAFLT